MTTRKVKRTKNIKKWTFSKQKPQVSKGTLLFTGALAVPLLFIGCDGEKKRETLLERPYSSIYDCYVNSDLEYAQCEQAHKAAIVEAQTSSPHYQSQDACERDYPDTQCRVTDAVHTGYMGGGHYYPHPTYFGHRNGFSQAFYPQVKGRTDGFMSVSRGTFNPRASLTPRTYTTTTSRGGFGHHSSRSWGG